MITINKEARAALNAAKAQVETFFRQPKSVERNPSADQFLREAMMERLERVGTAIMTRENVGSDCGEIVRRLKELRDAFDCVAPSKQGTAECLTPEERTAISEIMEDAEDGARYCRERLDELETNPERFVEDAKESYEEELQQKLTILSALKKLTAKRKAAHNNRPAGDVSTTGENER